MCCKMNLKQLMEEDLAVFFNPEELAEVHQFWIDGTRYKGAIIINDEGVRDRSTSHTDHVTSIYTEILTAHIPLGLIEEAPRKGLTFELDNREYEIIKVRESTGEVVLTLEVSSE